MFDTFINAGFFLSGRRCSSGLSVTPNYNSRSFSVDRIICSRDSLWYKCCSGRWLVNSAEIRRHSQRDQLKTRQPVAHNRLVIQTCGTIVRAIVLTRIATSFAAFSPLFVFLGVWRWSRKVCNNYVCMAVARAVRRTNQISVAERPCGSVRPLSVTLYGHQFRWRLANQSSLRRININVYLRDRNRNRFSEAGFYPNHSLHPFCQFRQQTVCLLVCLFNKSCFPSGWSLLNFWNVHYYDAYDQ